MHNPRQNPVGPDKPTVPLRFSKLQVLATLFSVAALFSIFKYVEYQFIAPNYDVRWEAFQEDQLEQLRRERRATLVMVQTTDRQQQERTMAVLNQPAVRRELYFLRAKYFRIDSNDPTSAPPKLPSSASEWRNRVVPQIADGGLALFASDAARPDWTLTDEEIAAEKLVQLLSNSR